MQPLAAYLKAVSEGSVAEVDLCTRGLGDDDLPTVIRTLQSAGKAVKVLDLQQNSITSKGVGLLCEFLESCGSIREVNLQENKIDESGADMVLNLLVSNDTITSFMLRDNAIGDDLIKQVDYAASINTQPTALKKRLSRRVLTGALSSQSSAVNGEVRGVEDDSTLDLSNSAGKLSLQLLAQAIEDSDNVESLSLANCGLGDPGLELIGKIICGKKLLKHLDLSRNSIATHGVKLFCELLKKNTSIKSIVLQGNKVSDDAARSLVEALQVNDSVTEVDVTDNAVSSRMCENLDAALDLNRQPTDLKRARQAMEGDDPRVIRVELQWHKEMTRSAYFLGSTLKLSTHVTVLNLSNAGFGDAGAKDLAKGLRFNKFIQVLELANNLITDEGGVALVDAVHNHPTLKDINLANNCLKNPTGRAFVDMLGLNDIVTELNVELNEIEDELMTELEGLVVINRQPLGIKRILHLIEANDPACTTVDFSTFDDHRFHTSDSVKVLTVALTPNSQVTTLNLSNNAIGDIGAQFLADYLLQTTSLKVLRLNDCSITNKGALLLIDALRANDVTEVVELKRNPLTETVASEFQSLLLTNTALKEVHLLNTKITDETQESIRINAQINAEPIALKRSLAAVRSGNPAECRVLDLSSAADSARCSDETVRILCMDLAGNGHVRTINLSNAKIGIESCRLLVALLTNKDNCVEVLNLASTPVDDACAKALAEGIAVNDTLKELDIRSTQITSEGLAALCDSLKDNNSVTAIRINREKYHSNVLGSLARQLALNTQVFSLKAVLPRIHENDPTLTHLTLEGTADVPFDDLSCQLLALGLQQNTTIVALDLANNAITNAGVEYLVDMLVDNKTIRSINLGGNKIDDDGGHMLVKSLETNDSIVNLDLEDTNISEEVLTEIMYLVGINNGPLALKSAMVAISTNDPSLKEVDFNGLHEGFRPFDDEAIHVLCSLLVENTNVREIDLANNQITNVGAALIADLLRVNSTLEAIYLENNRISRDGAEALFETLKSNHTLHTLKLDGNQVPMPVLENLQSVLVVNGQPLKEPRRQQIRDFRALDNKTLFRDADYMKDKEDDIFTDAMRDCPRDRLPKSIKLRELKY